MPDIVPATAPATTTGFHQGSVDPEAVKSANEATIRASESQGRHTGMSSDDLSDASSALDNLAKQVMAPDPVEPDPANLSPIPAPDKPADKPEVISTVISSPAVDPQAVTPPSGKDIFSDISLPPKASLKSSEAFATVKERAAQEIARVNALLEAEKSARAEIEAKAASLPEETAKELEELRKFRASLDVKAAPEFKEFDRKADRLEEFIFSQLKKSPRVTDEHLKQIKEIGGLGKIDLDRFLKSLEDPTLANIVQSKYADMEMLGHEKAQAMQAAEARATEYLKERAESLEQERGTTSKAAMKEFESLQGQVPWLQPKPGDENHNKLVTQVRQEVLDAMKDDSPKMRAILALGMGRLTVVSASLTAKTAALTASEAKVAELQKQLDGIRNSSARLKSGGASPDSIARPPQPTNSVNTDTAGALDAIAAQVVAERQRAGV